MRRLLVLLFLIATPAAANESVGCQDLWFTRNLVMDRAGYCFSTRLGQAMFDNGGCIGKTVSVDPRSSRLVAEIQALERSHGCKVSRNRTYLDLDDLWIRRQLIDLPIFDEFPGGCLGWIGPVTPLYAGRNPASAVIGRISPGDYVGFTHVPVGNWSYVTVSEPGWGPVKGGGWMNGTMQNLPCQDFAG
ncbi:DUF4453 domain-containing protein [Stappia sp. GBMRC 2046]|uniref:DUF4453 domain-containing protein n=1 Tax=Stappia sediminis TaxID=2692190 RepID=A0A7X3S961_9HYPH|nr:DUF4453 domain-containing protein [Stappia sediminis]MXN66601.1 DUF4453 domain-containing protein [Stappia sediminis]